MTDLEKAKKDILDNWTDTEREDALTAIYDKTFANDMIDAGSAPVATILMDKAYQEAILEINEEGGFVN